MNFWRPIDAIAEWLRHTFGVQAQLRLGVLMTIGGLLYVAYAPLTDEPVNIYLMSALALVFAGIGVVVTAETLAEVATDVDELVDADEDRCSTCGQKVPTG